MFRFLRSKLPGFLGAAFLSLTAATSATAQSVELRVVGGLASIRQFTSLEEPFWTQEVGRLTGGRVTATIHPFDHSGLRAQEMLHLIRLGVVPFGTAIISLAAGDDPEIGPIDLPGISPTMEQLRANVGAYRAHLAGILRERYGIELLGVYAYPAQVLFCKQPFSGLGDLKGRRIRTSSIGQSEMISALGALPVITAFGEIMPAINRGAVDCAVTGTLSGLEIGLSDATTHLHTMSMGWGLSIFAANETAWRAVPADIRVLLRQGIADLEARIWDAAERDTQLGIQCNIGSPACTTGKRARMTLVPQSAADKEILRGVMAGTVIPGWLDRCGVRCGETWNRTLGPTTGIFLNGNRADAPLPTATVSR